MQRRGGDRVLFLLPSTLTQEKTFGLGDEARPEEVGAEADCAEKNVYSAFTWSCVRSLSSLEESACSLRCLE